MSGDRDLGGDAGSSAVPPPPYSFAPGSADPSAASGPASPATGPPPRPPLGYEPVEAPDASGSGPLHRAAEKLRDTLESGALSGPGLRFGVAVCAAAALAAGLLLLWTRSGPEPDPPVPPEGSVEQHTAPASPERSDEQAEADADPSGTVVVHVGGDVEEPGLVELPEGSRVADALEAAGGANADADDEAVGALNLARRLVDGEQILVGTDVPPPEAGGPGAEDEGVPLDLNTATAEQLESLPGVGPVLAESIIEYRESNDGFDSMEELLDVRGIGEQRYEDLQDRVIVHGS